MRTLSLLFSAFVAMSVLASGCIHGPAAVRLPTGAGTDEDSTLGPGDLFEVRVYNEKELSGDFQVAPDGTVGFPFVGIMTVAGKDTRAVAQELSVKLKDGGYLLNPYVSVRMMQSNSKRISVLGAVAKPGTLSLISGMTVVQAISQAGGFSPLASKDETVVTRRVAGKLERYKIAMTQIARGDADDFIVRSGDLIFVPERVF